MREINHLDGLFKIIIWLLDEQRVANHPLAARDRWPRRASSGGERTRRQRGESARLEIGGGPEWLLTSQVSSRRSRRNPLFRPPPPSIIQAENGGASWRRRRETLSRSALPILRPPTSTNSVVASILSLFQLIHMIFFYRLALNRTTATTTISRRSVTAVRPTASSAANPLNLSTGSLFQGACFLLVISGERLGIVGISSGLTSPPRFLYSGRRKERREG